MFIKKMQDNKGQVAPAKIGQKDIDKKKEVQQNLLGQVPVKFNYMPCDLTYASLQKSQGKHASSNQRQAPTEGSQDRGSATN